MSTNDASEEGYNTYPTTMSKSYFVAISLGLPTTFSCFNMLLNQSLPNCVESIVKQINPVTSIWRATMLDPPEGLWGGTKWVCLSLGCAS
jgi:hypothetical protein